MEEKIKISGEICFWTAIIIELIIVIIEKSAYTNPYEGILFRLTFLLLFIKIAATKYSRGEWMVMIIIGSIAVISYLVNTKDEIVRAVALIAACKDMDLKKMLKVILSITLAGSLLLMFLAIAGIYGSISITADFGRECVETRYCFGMGHPNAFQVMLFMMSTLCMYVYASKMKWYHYILILAVNIISYMYTDSNTGMMVIAAAISGVMLLKYCKALRECKAIYIVSVILLTGIVIFSAYGSHVGRNTPVMFKIDKLINGRFQYSNIYEMARIENWKLFADPENTEYFDQGFIRLFYWYGIIPGITYIMANIYLIWQSYKKKDYTLAVIVVSYAVYMIMEAHIISVYLLRNYLFIWLGYYWYQPFKEKENKEYNFWQIKGLIGKA